MYFALYRLANPAKAADIAMTLKLSSVPLLSFAWLVVNRPLSCREKKVGVLGSWAEELGMSLRRAL